MLRRRILGLTQSSWIYDADNRIDSGGEWSMNKKPDFIGLGVRKAATSWLYACLYEHPEICMPVKEADFFATNWPRGFHWYESLFDSCPERTLCGELSTSYFSSLCAQTQISTWYPDAKLFVCLRNPIDRAFSDYKHYIMTGVIDRTMPFLTACEKYPEIVIHGYYGKHLERWRKYHPRGTENLSIMLYHYVQERPEIEIKLLCRWLGVDMEFEPSMLYKRVNESRIPKVQCLERPMLNISHKLNRFSPWLWWTIKKTGIGTYVKRLNARKQSLALTETERALTYNHYKKDIARLEDLTGFDLEGWRV